MLKVISCPQCGHHIVKAENGSRIQYICPKCKSRVQSYVDNEGGVHALPLDKQTKASQA